MHEPFEYQVEQGKITSFIWTTNHIQYSWQYRYCYYDIKAYKITMQPTLNSPGTTNKKVRDRYKQKSWRSLKPILKACKEEQTKWINFLSYNDNWEEWSHLLMDLSQLLLLTMLRLSYSIRGVWLWWDGIKRKTKNK